MHIIHSDTNACLLVIKALKLDGLGEIQAWIY